MDPSVDYDELHSSEQSNRNSFIAPLPIESGQSPRRPGMPSRASTFGSSGDLERSKTKRSDGMHARSEDLNHSHMNGVHTIREGYSNGNVDTDRSEALVDMHNNTPSNYFHALNGTSGEGGGDSVVVASDMASKQASSSSVGPNTPTICGSCQLPLEGPFVRALGNVWHLQCFKCKDCDTVVASKFFPIDGPDGKQQPLCERDYFGRLNLLCAKCGLALRGSYITACSRKYHVEHFTCSVCPTLFGPQDSYYEHDGNVFCHLHYSIRFATKCAGCNSAILKQFVEINRNNRDECWHPECYMINKFWNVKIVSRKPMSPSPSSTNINEPTWVEEEQRETAASLKEKQIRMEQQVYRIWTVLSAFEESSAACISDMLRHVSNGEYLQAIRMAEKFILHVEVLFGTIDDLETHFARLNLKGMSHVREARMLCRKTVDLFTLLSHPQESGQRRMGMTQELLALVTGLAHYLKILIRIALTGGLKLEREHDAREAMTSFLDKLHLLAIEGGNPAARRVVRGGEKVVGASGGARGTQGVTYGFRSLAPEFAGDSPFGSSHRDIDANTSSAKTAPLNNLDPPTDSCVKCKTTIEEDCIRLGTYQRWHSHCVQCQTCGKASAPPIPKEANPGQAPSQIGEEKEPIKMTAVRRLPADTDNFVYEVESVEDSPYGDIPRVIYCREHSHERCRSGFEAVSKLEQYAFLLNVALRRLCYLLKRRGVMPTSPGASSNKAPSHEGQSHDSYRDSGVRMKSVHLDRKISTTARLPKRSMVVESPSGKIAQATDLLHTQRPEQSSTQRAQGQGGVRQNATATNRPVTLGPSSSQQQQSRPRLTSPGTTVDERGQLIPPTFTRSNTEIMIVDESAPASPAGGPDESTLQPSDDGITLADIPQLIEAEQARELHRPLPQGSRPLIAELTSLELMIVKHAALLSLYRSPLKSEFDLDEVLELIENKKSSFWNKIFKGNKQQKKGVFGVPLEILVEKEGTDSMHGASNVTLRVPTFIDDVISAMRQMDMSVEGIFRRNGNIRRLNELTEAIDRDPSSVDLTQDNPVQLAALLKKFLKTLPEPLMTFKLYRLFMAAENMPNEDERTRYLHLVMMLLPKGSRDTSEVLFVFLKWVASFAHVDEETGNKMDLHNLATVISPNIFRGFSKANDAVRVETFESIRVMDSLLERQDEFYTVPEEFLPLLRDQEHFANYVDLPSKEFLKKFDAYLRAKVSGRQNGLASPVQSSAPFNSSGSNSLASMSREVADGRLATQRSDPALSRGRLPQSGSHPIERPTLNQTPMSSDGIMRNDHPSSRNQSPHQRLPHQPLSYTIGSPPNQPLVSPIPRAAFAGPDNDWFQPSSPAPGSFSKPNSTRPTSYTPRSSGEQFTPNGHTPAVQLRQRTS